MYGQKRKERREKEYGQGRAVSQRVQKSKRTSNLSERMSSGRVIESENQSTHPRSAFHFVLSIVSQSSPVSPLQSYHFYCYRLFSLLGPTQNLYFHLVLISNFRAIAFSAHLPRENRVMVKTPKSWETLCRRSNAWDKHLGTTV